MAEQIPIALRPMAQLPIPMEQPTHSVLLALPDNVLFLMAQARQYGPVVRQLQELRITGHWIMATAFYILSTPPLMHLLAEPQQPVLILHFSTMHQDLAHQLHQ